MHQGILFIALAAASLATNTTLAKLSYMGGLTAPTLLLIRFLMGAVILSSSLKLRGLPIVPSGAVRRTIGAALCVMSVAVLFMGAASRIPLSLAVVLVFTYPVWTVILSRLMGMEIITPGKVAAVAMALAGIALSVGPKFGNIDLWGVLMAAGAGFAFGLLPTVARRLSHGVDPMQVNTFVAYMGIPVSLTIGLASGTLVWPQGTGLWLSTLGSAVFYITGLAFVLTGINRTDPTKAAVTQTLEPLLTVILAVVVLGEPLSSIQLVGATLILAAILTVTLQRSATPAPIR